MKIVPFLVLGLFVFSIISIPLSQNVSASVLGGIPPTPAIKKIGTQNSTVIAMNYSSWLHFQGLGPITVTGNNKTKTIYFNATIGNGTTLTALTCSADYQFHSLTISGGIGTLHCAKNNSTGGSGTTLDTMQNVTPAQAYVFKTNTTNVNFQFRGFNVTGSSCNISNSTSLITLYCKTWQNNTGTNLGTHGIGPFSSMLGSVLQFFSLVSANSQLALSSNSTNIIFTIQHVITDTFKSNNVNCAIGFFVKTFSNSTGTYGCGNAITQINNQSGTTITITNNVQGNTKVTSSGNIIKVDSNNTAQIANADGSGVGFFGSKINNTKNTIKTLTAGRNINLYNKNSTTNLIQSNNTAYGRNIYSNSGTSGGSGVGPYLNNTNTTLMNFKSIVSRNQYILATTNNTNIILNASVPMSNVIDIYDTTIVDYTTPTSATNSSSMQNSNPASTTQFDGGSTTSKANTSTWTQKITGLTSTTRFDTVSYDIAAGTAGTIHLQALVYDNTGSGGGPGHLVAKSATNILVSTGVAGFQAFTLNQSVTVPASGIFWVGFQTDLNNEPIFLGNSSATQKSWVATFGSPSNPAPATTSSVTNGEGTKLSCVGSNCTGHPPSQAVDGNTATYWESTQEVHPWIYVDTGSAQILSGTAMFWNSSSTSTQILLQTSTDATNWNTKRTVNTNLLTNNAWNYIRWDLDTSTERYVRFYGNDGTAKQLSFYELKVLIPTSTNLLMRHGHEFIDSTNATLPLSR